MLNNLFKQVIRLWKKIKIFNDGWAIVHLWSGQSTRYWVGFYSLLRSVDVHVLVYPRQKLRWTNKCILFNHLWVSWNEYKRKVYTWLCSVSPESWEHALCRDIYFREFKLRPWSIKKKVEAPLCLYIMYLLWSNQYEGNWFTLVLFESK